MSEINRDELRRLLAEATPGPWVAEVSGPTGPVVMDAQSVSALDHVAKCPHYRGSADSELIAAAVNALPDLLDALEKAEAHRDSLAATLIEHRILTADLLAQAWDEGYKLDWTGGVRHPNPYRQEAER